LGDGNGDQERKKDKTVQGYCETNKATDSGWFSGARGSAAARKAVGGKTGGEPLGCQRSAYRFRFNGLYRYYARRRSLYQKD